LPPREGEGEDARVLVEASDDTPIAVLELGGAGHDATLLFSHATGFHGKVFQPMADLLVDAFHCVALDHRGHGDTPSPGPVDWTIYGDDTLTVARAVSGGDPGAPLYGFGHSMGGAALLMAALDDPSLFAGLVLFEPIVPQPGRIPGRAGNENPLSAGARRRRASFPSFAAAIENFSSKPPLDVFTPEALRAYVEHGFLLGEDGQVHIKCTPEHEARTYELGGQHDTWERLVDVRTPVAVVSGRREELQPSGFAELIADRLPDAELVRLPELGHFGPMEDPARLATIVRDFVAER
jgi:pimeloyl-ACP methyl ester carboxylesterase